MFKACSVDSISLRKGIPKMPSKRAKRTKQTDQKNIVTSTLLTLSLKFDNQRARKIISLQQAKDYIREISNLNIESDDTRSRQVSEKFTYMLKDLYTNKVTDSENSNTFSLNNNIEKKLNENFESKSNEGLNIRHEFCEASVVTTNSDHSQNNLTEPGNIEDRINTNYNISTPINNMPKNFRNEAIQVKNNNDNINLYTALPVKKFNMTSPPMNKEYINESNSKNTNNELSAIKNKTVCINNTNMITSTECVNNRIISKDNIKKPSKSKKRNLKKKQKNDLMWIENIKFIREIDREEHLVSNLEESFWSNLTKPANCSADFETD